MSQSVQTILNAIAPLVASNENANVYITLATDGLNECHFGGQYNYAVALRAAHIGSLALRSQTGDAGSISSKKEGDLSLSYNTGSMEDGDLSQTSYGRQLLALIQSTNPGIGATGGLDNGCSGSIPPIIGCSSGF